MFFFKTTSLALLVDLNNKAVWNACHSFSTAYRERISKHAKDMLVDGIETKK
jgi:diacylglycerol kinase